MGLSKVLYEGQPTDALAVVVTAAAASTTRITFAVACNTTDADVTLSCYFGSTQVVRTMALGASETLPILGVAGATMDAGDTLRMQASVASAVSVKIDGHEVSTS